MTDLRKKTAPLKGRHGVYKRGRVWKAVVELPRDTQTGRRRRVWLTGFRSQREAIEARAQALADQRTGGFAVPTRLTVAQLVERFVEDRRATGKCEAKTLERYRDHQARIARSPIGSATAMGVQPLAIEQWYQALIASGRKDGKGGLSPLSIRHVHAVLRGAFRWALKKKLLAFNPIAAVELPTMRQREIRALTEDEVARLLATVAGTRYEMPFTLLLATGARRGEIAALQWDAVNVEDATMVIRQAFSELSGHRLVVKSTKTGKPRTIPLDPAIVALLRRHRAHQAQERLAAGGAYQDAGWVLADALGGPIKLSALTTGFVSAAHKAGITGANLHSLRHTAATAMLAAGAGVPDAQAILGHSVGSTTLNIYGHGTPGRQRGAVAILAAMLERARGEQAS